MCLAESESSKSSPISVQNFLKPPSNTFKEMDRASYSPKTLGTRLSYPNLVSPADYAREANKFFIQLELERVPEGRA